jgi:DNA invertase Pin-like site-specific DNA recombinase
MTPRNAKLTIIAYLRVSTQKQGQSGLGLEAQKEAIESFARQRGATVKKTFIEIESGKHSDRPKLNEALYLAKVTRATLCIAKLDRLSRNAAFLLALRDSGVKFIAADMPDANELTVGILAVVAQAEREAISRRTKEALQAAKARGTKLGNPRGAECIRRAAKGNVDALKAIVDNANRHAEDLRPVIDSLRKQGLMSLGSIAQSLNDLEMHTPRGGLWYKSSVKNLLDRLKTLPANNSLAFVG